jgi:hypothetical protein
LAQFEQKLARLWRGFSESRHFFGRNIVNRANDVAQFQKIAPHSSGPGAVDFPLQFVISTAALLNGINYAVGTPGTGFGFGSAAIAAGI